MRILSFNASSSTLDICLTDAENILAKRSIASEPNEINASIKRKSRQFSASLIIPTTEELLKEVGWQKSQLDLIAVGIGPGSFTGIRVAVVTARTLAQALNLPLLGISEFECYAFNEKIQEFPALIVLNAGKNQYYCAHIEKETSFLPNQKTLAEYQLNWDMTTSWLTEDQLKSRLANYKCVIKPSSEQQTDTSSSLNYAVTQALLTQKRLTLSQLSKQQLIDIFPYHIIRPLYVRNASITISSAAKANKT